jgi:hypothetical protein
VKPRDVLTVNRQSAHPFAVLEDRTALGCLPATARIQTGAIRAGRGFELTAQSCDVERMFAARIALAGRRSGRQATVVERFLCARDSAANPSCTNWGAPPLGMSSAPCMSQKWHILSDYCANG